MAQTNKTGVCGSLTLNELPAAKTVDDVDALMPWHIKNKITTQS
jgi:hypothetical protein